MSVFSKIKQSRKAAKEHKAQIVEKENHEGAMKKAPYKHVPTHAAVDALSGAPSSWKHEDRSKIKEHHQRRSQLVLSRTGSSLSTGSFMNAGTSSQSSILPRNASYNSVNPTWFDRTGDAHYSNEPKERRARSSRHHSHQDSGNGVSVGPSPLASQVHSEDTSPVNSSGNSALSSSENLPEIRSNSSTRLQPMVFAEKDIFQRLHTSTTRKVGEAPLYDSPPVKSNVTASVAALSQEVKPKKQRWSIMSKRSGIAAA